MYLLTAIGLHITLLGSWSRLRSRVAHMEEVGELQSVPHRPPLTLQLGNGQTSAQLRLVRRSAIYRPIQAACDAGPPVAMPARETFRTSQHPEWAHGMGTHASLARYVMINVRSTLKLMVRALARSPATPFLLRDAVGLSEGDDLGSRLSRKWEAAIGRYRALSRP